MKTLIKYIIIFTFAYLITITASANEPLMGLNSKMDTSNIYDKGTISISLLKPSTKSIAVTIAKDGTQYQYFLNNKTKTESFAFTMGEGTYTVKVLENITGNRYSVLQVEKIQVEFENEFTPFLSSNQFVNFTNKNNTVKTANKLVSSKKTDLQKIDTLYAYVSKTISYDNKKAKIVKSGYVPTVDTILKTKKGICFDYAAVLSSMLRAQDIPTRLVTGYVAPNNAFHAWNEIYTKEKGWIKTATMKFNGKKWELADPTFTSATIKKDASKSLIGDGTKYTRSKQY